jgi:4-amino-4-deoxy-L-arabinose transferase-like glycosyltransferase
VPGAEWAVISALTLLGIALRLPALGDSLFGDELSSYFVVTGRSLAGTLHLLNGKAIELNPPLYFLLAWTSEKLAGESQESLRLVSLLAGTASIPLTFVLGRLTVGRRPGLVATALVTLSPFLIFFSAEARAYALLMVMLLLSTIGLLQALRTGRLRWWGLYAVCSCGAMYTHYTSIFLLIGQFGWAFWTHPRARRALVGANAVAAAAFAPWLPYLINTTHSPGRNVIGFLTPFGLHAIRLALETWSVGHPFLSLTTIPGSIAVAMIVAGVCLALPALALRRVQAGRETGNGRANGTPVAGPQLPLVLAASTPVGLALYSLLGSSVWDARDLISSWPGFAAALAALLTSAGELAAPGGRGRAPKLALAVLPAALVFAGFTIGAARMVQRSHRRPDYDAAASFIASAGAPGDPVVDLGALTPGPPNETEAALALTRRSRADLHPVVRLAQPPLAVVLRAPPYARLAAPRGEVVAREAAMMATHGRLFFVLSGYASLAVIQAQRVARTPDPEQTVLGQLAAFLRALPRDFQPVALRRFPGLFPVTVYEFRRPST